MSPVVFVILCFKENDSQFGKERVMRYRREKEGGKTNLYLMTLSE